MVTVERTLTSVVAAVALTLAACQPSSEQVEERETMSSSAFRNAYETLAASPSDSEISRSLGEASLASLQGGVDATDYQLVEPLTELVTDSRAPVRAAAARLLGFLVRTHRRANDSPLSDSERAAVRPQVETAITALAARFDDEDAAVRLATLQAVTFADDPELIAPLLERLDDSDSTVRLQALMRLHDLRDAAPDGRIADAARELLDDPDPQVRELAELVAARFAT